MYDYVTNPTGMVDPLGLAQLHGCQNPQMQERANEIAEEIVQRGYFQGKGETDWLYQINSDPDLAITIDASKLTATARGPWTPDPNGGYSATGYIRDAYVVHGQVTIRHRPDNTYGIYNESYDFEMHNDFTPRGIARNLGTFLGGPPSGWCNTPYNINFEGNTNITNPR